MALNLTTIDYDLPVTNLIAGLNKTGHITHTKYKKKGVTRHHNGGRLSHQGVLDVWKYRPASAHFDIDAFGQVAQYANVFEYAWHAGNTRGNQISVGIEMCNLTLAPTWEVADVTWQGAARLSAWLYSSGLIGPKPDPKTNMWSHHDWLPTACWGPYMDKIHAQIDEATMDYYATFKRGGQAPAPTPSKPAPTKPSKPSKPSGKLDVDGVFGAKSVRALQTAFRSPVDGEVWNQPLVNKINLPALTAARFTNSPARGGSPVVRHLQSWVRVAADGYWGANTNRALQSKLGVTRDGVFGKDTARALQKALNDKKVR